MNAYTSGAIYLPNNILFPMLLSLHHHLSWQETVWYGHLCQFAIKLFFQRGFFGKNPKTCTHNYSVEEILLFWWEIDRINCILTKKSLPLGDVKHQEAEISIQMVDEVVVGWQLDLMILEVFSSLNDSMGG